MRATWRDPGPSLSCSAARCRAKSARALQGLPRQAETGPRAPGSPPAQTPPSTRRPGRICTQDACAGCVGGPRPHPVAEGPTGRLCGDRGVGGSSPLWLCSSVPQPASVSLCPGAPVPGFRESFRAVPVSPQPQAPAARSPLVTSQGPGLSCRKWHRSRPSSVSSHVPASGHRGADQGCLGWFKGVSVPCPWLPDPCLSDTHWPCDHQGRWGRGRGAEVRVPAGCPSSSEAAVTEVSPPLFPPERAEPPRKRLQ